MERATLMSGSRSGAQRSYERWKTEERELKKRHPRCQWCKTLESKHMVDDGSGGRRVVCKPCAQSKPWEQSASRSVDYAERQKRATALLRTAVNATLADKLRAERGIVPGALHEKLERYRAMIKDMIHPSTCGV